MTPEQYSAEMEEIAATEAAKKTESHDEKNNENNDNSKEKSSQLNSTEDKKKRLQKIEESGLGEDLYTKIEDACQEAALKDIKKLRISPKDIEKLVYVCGGMEKISDDEIRVKGVISEQGSETEGNTSWPISFRKVGDEWKAEENIDLSKKPPSTGVVWH